jgi:transitional endoplasmic reticulum ATPase
VSEQPSRGPGWAEQLRRSYLSGETSLFVLHRNVFDRVLHKGATYDVPHYLAQVLFRENKRNILIYTPSVGVEVVQASAEIRGIPELQQKKPAGQMLGVLEAILLSTDSTALIVPYADMLVPPGDANLLGEQDRAAVIALHRWSLHTELGKKDNIVVLLTETLAGLHPKLVSNPRVSTIELPLPAAEERTALIRHCDPSLPDALVARLAAHGAGLKAVQIAGLVTPRPASDLDEAERRRFIAELLREEPHAQERAEKLATMTRGMSQHEIRKLLRPGQPAERAPSEQNDEDGMWLSLFGQRKREIIERECAGLIEFIEPKHDLDAVGGLVGVKEELAQVADAFRARDRARCPMGMLFVGPMGCGKTFVANAFVKRTGLPAVRLKNFRSKWVGSTESNLETVLHMVKALGPIVLIIDEGDRALADEGESDGGTGSRVIARLKEFMSDPDNRGLVMVILMTNRPDKLDVDIKRAGRLDKKIPFFYPDRAEDVEAVLQAVFRRHAVEVTVDFQAQRADTSERLVGYSNADIEAVALLAHELAQRAKGPVDAEILRTASVDYVPSRDVDMLEYMELLAAFEASRRSLLPERLRELSSEELNQRLKRKRAAIRS